MARDEAPPFELGQTYYQNVPIDAANLDGVNLEGKEFQFEDNQFGTGHKIRVRVVRNSGPLTLAAKRLVTFDSAFYGRRCNGYAKVDSDFAKPVDPLIGPAGILPNDLFYIIMEGPTLVKTPLDAGADNVIAVGDNLVSLTAATSGATTAGRAYTALFTGATAVLAGQVRNVIGRAMSAATTANTNSDLLVGVGW